MTSISQQWEMVEMRESVLDDTSAPQWSDVLPVPTLSVQQKSIIMRLAEFSRLPSDWDSYGSPPISAFATAVALSIVIGLGPDFFSDVSVVPVSGGGVQFEWNILNRSLEVEVGPTGEVDFLKAEENVPLEEGPIEDGSFAQLRSLIAWTLFD